MALYYLDTSALVKLYIREIGTERMLRLVRTETGHRFVILAIAEVEFRSALRRRQRAGDVEASVATQLIERFVQHVEARFIRQSLTERVLEMAVALIDRYPLRTYDAIQLAGCLLLRANPDNAQPIFACADSELVACAEEEGVATLNPET